MDEFKSYLMENYCTRINVISDKVEIKEVTESNFYELDDITVNSIWRLGQKISYGITVSKIYQILYSDFSQSYNPIKDYLTNLKWDGKDYIGQACNCLKTETPNVRKYLEKWLIGAANNVINPHLKRNEVCLILKGSQGIGKTQFFWNLVKNTPAIKHFIKMNHSSNKDCQLGICTNWISLFKMEGNNKRSIEAIKIMFVNNNEYSIKVSYNKSVKKYRRLSAFCGTVNNAEFLYNITENKNFIVFDCTDIDYTRVVDNDGLWGQVMHLLKIS